MESAYMAIQRLFILIKSKCIYTAATSKAFHFDTYPNLQEILYAYLSPFLHPFLLIIREITTHTPLKYRILHLKHANMHCKVYNLMSLYTYKANFATSSTLQEMLLTDKHNASIPQTFHLFNYSYL